MADLEDGGPAFPIMAGGADLPGMSLRDYFAAKALQGILAGINSVGDEQYTEVARRLGTKTKEETNAKMAYLCADAMLEAKWKNK